MPAAHVYGPRAPHIGFWYGTHYLGETRFPFTSDSPVQDAKTKIADCIRQLQPGPEGQANIHRLLSPECEARIYY